VAGPASTTREIRLGHYPGASYLAATVDELRIYEGALTADAVLDSYRDGRLVHLKLDEGAGTTAADASGNGNNGTLINGAAWAPGTSGQGVALDGVDDYVRVPHTAALNAFPLTVTAWFKTSTTSGVGALVNKYTAGSFNGYQVYFYNGSLCAWYIRGSSAYIYDGTSCTLSTAGYNDGQWHQASFVVDASGGRLFVDGVEKASRAWTGAAGPTSTTQEIRFGHYPGGSYLSGTVDELRIYKRALTGAEVLQLYDDSRPRADAGPIAHLKLDEGTGTTTADASGNGNNGTLINGAAWAAGATGQGVAVDGVDDYVSVPHTAALNAFPLTVTAWFKTSTTSGVGGLVNKYAAGSFNGYQLYFYNGSLCAWYMKGSSAYIYDGTTCTLSTAGYNDGQWHQASFVVDASGGRLFVDGVEKASRAWTGVPGPASTSQEIRLGHYPGASYLAATVDEVRIYGRALTAAEVLALAQ
jgi:hypothetical protein